MDSNIGYTFAQNYLPSHATMSKNTKPSDYMQ